MTDPPKVTLHDVSIEGDVDSEGMLDAVQRAVLAVSRDGRTPAARSLKASIAKFVPDTVGGGEA